MPRATVRQAIANYFTSGIGTIPSLSTVYQHPPKITPEGDFYQGESPGIEDGAVIYLHLGPHDERRIAIGGPTSGRKARMYPVVLICYLRHKGAKSQDAGAANDAFIDGVTAWIQKNRTANSAGVIFQWGEGDQTGGVDIRVEAAMPKGIRQQASQVFTTVDVTCLEILNT